MIGAGDSFRPVGINAEGLGRRGFTPADIQALKDAYKILYRRQLNVEQAIDALEGLQAERPAEAPAVQTLIDFLRASSRGIARP
jgi:UDP-N-acetylglucosamine acyltransferase